MPSALLNGRAILNVTGEDAESFLQNLITTDLDSLQAGKLRPGALLSPQGKILFEFLVSRSADGLRLDTLQSAADDFVKRLSLYKLRAKAQISVDSESLTAVSWENGADLSQSDSTVQDERFPDMLKVHRHYGSTAAMENSEAWTRLRITYGVAEAPQDYTLGDAFPHDINFDQTGGVSFKKGCFIGQEVVSRMQHRGTARRRILIVESATDLPSAGTPVTANERELGTLGSVAGRSGLALVRIDRVKDAMDSSTPILAGDTRIDLAIPPEHRFTFPVTAQEA
jgi:tRNA-modifying protein YgfZ